MSIRQTEYDAIIVGSGPGGASVARGLAQAGRKVLVLEWGKDYRNKWYYGTHVGALIYCDKHGLLFSREKLNIVRGIMTGGSTNLYCGCAAPPPEWLKNRYKVNIDKQVSQTIDELKIAPLQPQHLGEASQRILDAGIACGTEWEPQLKFMNPDRSPSFNCGATCMTGCSCKAKWTANEYLDEAVYAGARLETGVKIDRAIVEDGVAVGVAGKRGREPFEARGKTVVLASGGIGTPIILQNSGVQEAGRGMTMDPTVMVYGALPGKGGWDEPPMTVSYEDLENGYMLASLVDPWMLYPLVMAMKGAKYAWSFLRYKRMMGIMIKVTDEIAGEITFEGEISKPMTQRDRDRLNHAAVVSRGILLKAGADPDSIFMSPIRGTHPSGTVRIGEAVDTNLQTRIPNLYVSDASTFPQALGRPTVLTIIGLGKRLAEHLNREAFGEKPTQAAKRKAS